MAGRLIRARTQGFVLATLLAAVAPALLRAGVVYDPACGQIRVALKSNTTVYRLPHGFVRAGSDTVCAHGTMLRRGVDYVLDPVRGELRMLRDIVPGDTLVVDACWLLAPPPTEFELMSYRPHRAPGGDGPGCAGCPVAVDTIAGGPPAQPGGAPLSRPATAHDPGAAAPGASLVVSGNKTLAVEFGSSQDAFLRQSLDLAVSGNLAPGVRLTGVLSDRDLPLNAGGTTEGLQSLDRVLIELDARSPADAWSGSAALGDVALSLQRGEFARLERRVQGVRGEFGAGGFRGQVAAADAQGEYRRLEFIGVEGRQGPYPLTDRDGRTGIVVVAGSDAVSLDGVRMTRGEGADYSVDYERATLTFSSRRPISSESRIAVDYQYTSNRYRRNLAAAGGGWEWPRGYLFTQAVTESDDRGRPIDLALGPDDRLTLALAGDSTAFALGAGVTPGVGDYDTVRVAGSLAFAYAGPDSGRFDIQFTRAGSGLGAYADSGLIAGRTVYRYVGSGRGDYRVGRALPLPESHQVWSAGGGVRAGPLALEVEGAVSRHDLNTFSSLDDGDNLGPAGRASLALEGALPGPLAARAGLAVRARAVDQRFTPFARLETPFANQDWGVAGGGDLEHQRRVEASAFLRPRAGGELKGTIARLGTPGGFASLRRTLEWSADGRVATRASYERADGRQEGLRFAAGGRERAAAELRLHLPWLEPALRVESDERRTPSDSLPQRQRFRECALELQSPRGTGWHALAGATLRRDARLTVPGPFADQSEARTLRLGIDSPEPRPLAVGLAFQHRDLRPLAGKAGVAGVAPGVRVLSDLGSLRVRGEDRARALRGSVNVELTTEGENRRHSTLVFVGPGRGSYDASGNFVAGGDYDLRVSLSPDLERLARAVTSAHLEWGGPAARAENPSPWAGSRAGFDFETETRRRGELLARDPAISPGAVLGDPRLERGRVLQRLEADLRPESPAAALRLRAERRVTADRAESNFGQTLDERQFSARWRARPGAAVSSEVEGRWSRRVAAQGLTGSAGYARTLLDHGLTAQLIYTPRPGLRAVAGLEASWSRPDGQPLATRTVRVGPEVGFPVGRRGHAEASVRRAFLTGPPPSSLLPSLDPAGAPRWEGQARVDYRVYESTTFGLSMNGQERPGLPTRVIGRAELRAFF